MRLDAVLHCLKHQTRPNAHINALGRVYPAFQSYMGLSITGIQCIATKCQKLKHVEFYQCENVNLRETFRLFDGEEHRENLERIFVYRGFWRRPIGQLPLTDDLPFMAPCEKCGLYYNQLKNQQEMLCLYHPGVNFIS